MIEFFLNRKLDGKCSSCGRVVEAVERSEVWIHSKLSGEGVEFALCLHCLDGLRDTATRALRAKHKAIEKHLTQKSPDSPP